MKEDIVQKSIECLANAKLNDTTYEVARNITLDYITDLQQENKKLKSIIKEAREYIKEHICNDMKYPDYMEITKKEYYKLLEILDKENK